MDSATVKGRGAIMRNRWSWVAWELLALGLLGNAVGVVLSIANGEFLRNPGESILLTLAFGSFLVVGCLLLARRPDNVIGGIFTAVGLLTATAGVAEGYAKYAFVTLPAVAAAALAEHLATYSQPGPDGLVFTSTEGGLLRRSNFNRRVWQPATRAAGLAGLRFHDLQHTSATLSIAAGASTRELMARMGHSSSAAALRYQHVMAGRDAAIAAALDELIEAASSLAERPPPAPSGTQVARIGQSDKGQKRR